MSIKEWPEDERPREKLLRQGPGGLSDAELLAIFLRTGVSGLSAVDLSRHLLQQFGSLRALLGAEQRAFARRTALDRPNMPSCRRCWRWASAIWPSSCKGAIRSPRPS